MDRLHLTLHEQWHVSGKTLNSINIAHICICFSKFSVLICDQMLRNK